MKHPHATIQELEQVVIKKYQNRDKRKQPKMKVSGKQVQALQRLIGKKK